MKDANYWLWLQKSLGYGANLGYLIRYFGSARGVYEAGENAWRKSGLFGTSLFDVDSSRINSLRSTSLYSCEKTVALCERENISIVTPQDEEYPQLLKRIENFPAVLFVKGDLSFVNRSSCVAVVGTRKPSEYGRKAARSIANGLVKAGVCVISGGALGVDSIAHTAAVEGDGKTVMVLGCGIGYDYLKENEALRQAVSESGAVISEYVPGSSASLKNFPMRNRIISGISRGVAIIEAGEKSGTLNTARHAKKQNRDLFVVPGDISSISFGGSNKLIREGAKAIFSANDVLSYYALADKAVNEIEAKAGREPFYGIHSFKSNPTDHNTDENKPQRQSLQRVDTVKENDVISEIPESQKCFSPTPPDGVSENAKIMYNLLSDGRSEIDELTRDSGLDVRDVLIALTELEMEKAAVSLGGNRYALC